MVPLILIPLHNPIAEIANLVIGVPSEKLVHNVTSINLNIDNDIFRWIYLVFFVCSEYGHLYYLTSTGLMLALIFNIKESISQITKRRRLSMCNANDALLKVLTN